MISIRRIFFVLRLLSLQVLGFLVFVLLLIFAFVLFFVGFFD